MLSLLAALALSVPLPPVPVEGPRWTLTGLTPDAPQNGGTLRIPGPRLTRPAFTVRGGVLIGTTGCSSLRARVAVSGNMIRVWDVQSGTSDRCPDHALALREDFTTLLRNATRIGWRGSTLILHSGTGRLEFTAAPPP